MPQLDKSPGPNDTYDDNGNGPDPPQSGEPVEGDNRLPSGALAPPGMRWLPVDLVGPVEAAETPDPPAPIQPRRRGRPRKDEGTVPKFVVPRHQLRRIPDALGRLQPVD